MAVQFAIACLVALAADFAQGLKQRRQLVEVFQGVMSSSRTTLYVLCGVGQIMCYLERARKSSHTVRSAQMPWRKSRAEQNWDSCAVTSAGQLIGQSTTLYPT